MKKSWIIFLLTPIISFAAYPVYESEADEFEELELVFDAPEFQEQEVAEVEHFEAELAFVLDEEFTKQEPVNEELAQAEPLIEEKVESAAVQSTQAAIGQKRAPVKKNPASKVPSVPRQKIKDARDNSNRPRVTHREAVQGHAPNVDGLEADAQQESKIPTQKSSPKPASQNPSPNVQLKPASSGEHRIAAPQAAAPTVQQKPAAAPQKKVAAPATQQKPAAAPQKQVAAPKPAAAPQKRVAAPQATSPATQQKPAAAPQKRVAAPQATSPATQQKPAAAPQKRVAAPQATAPATQQKPVAAPQATAPATQQKPVAAPQATAPATQQKPVAAPQATAPATQQKPAAAPQKRVATPQATAPSAQQKPAAPQQRSQPPQNKGISPQKKGQSERVNIDGYPASRIELKSGKRPTVDAAQEQKAAKKNPKADSKQHSSKWSHPGKRASGE